MTRPDQAPRTPAQREADHAAIATLSDSLLPALVARLGASALGELEVREGDWSVRLRRPPQVPGASRRAGRGPGHSGHHTSFAPDGSRAQREATPDAARGDGLPDPGDDRRAVATSPAVGIFRPGSPVGTKVRAGDRIAVVDLLGIPQDVSSPIDGTVVEVFVQAGDAVEYGEDIAAVEADAPGPEA